MASVKQGDFSEVQRDAARDEFFRLLRTHPALEEVYKLKRAKKLPLTDFDIEQAKEKDPSIDVHEVVDVYEKAHFPASPASSGSDDTENTEDKEEKKKDDKEGNDEDYDGDADERVEESVEKASNDGGRQENISPESISGMRVVAKGDGASEKGEEIPAEGRQKTINADVKNKGTVKSNGFGEENVGESSEEEGGEKDGEGDEGKKSEESKRGSSHKFNVGSLNKESREKIEGLMRKYHVSTGEDGKTEAPGYAELATPFLSSPATRMGRSRRQEGERRGGFDTARKARRAWRLGKKVKGSGFLSKMLRPSARNLIQGVARVVSLLPGGKVVLIVIGAIILLLIIAFLIINKSSSSFESREDAESAPPGTALPPGTGEDGDSLNPIPGLDLGKAGPDQAQSGEVVEYTITAEYDGSLDVLVYDPIAPNAEYVSSDPPGEYDDKDEVISWRLDDFEPDFEDGDLRTYNFQLSLRPTLDDIIITNQAFASAVSSGSTPPNLETDNFEELVRGQGRNVDILGSEDEFVETIFANTQEVRFPGGRGVYEPYIRDLYQVASRNNINPVIMLTIWGVEQSLQIVDGLEFGCDPNNSATRGFENQVQCSADTLNHWMNKFDEIAARDGLPVPYTVHETCQYRDPFLYAYEAYTPVCTMDHGNDGARTNFIIYYKEFLQGPS